MVLPIVYAYGSVEYFLSSSIDDVARAATQAPVFDMFRGVLQDVQMASFSSLRSVEVELLIYVGLMPTHIYSSVKPSFSVSSTPSVRATILIATNQAKKSLTVPGQKFARLGEFADVLIAFL
ncbi:MAG: hypothetical protein M1835_000929 [Candelina submexicana]|nr:MAG: hypothetical protein M1835_000929 [Candelina submexicana]